MGTITEIRKFSTFNTWITKIMFRIVFNNVDDAEARDEIAVRENINTILMNYIAEAENSSNAPPKRNNAEEDVVYHY